jgi:hypothetical protein
MKSVFVNSTNTKADRNVEHRQQEKHLLEILLQSGKFQQAIDAGLTDTDFTDPAYSLLFNFATNRIEQGEAVDKMDCIINLRDRLQQDEQDRIVALDDLGDSSGLIVPELAAVVMENSRHRQIASLIHRAELHCLSGNFEKAKELASQASELGGGKPSTSILETYSERKFDASAKPEKPPAILSLKCNPVLTESNIATLQGPEKSAKSHAAAAMVRGCLGLSPKLSITSETRGAVAYVDAEQSTFDFWQLLNNSIGEHPDFHAYNVTGEDPANIRKLLEAICAGIKNLKLLIVDGYADLLTDVNDAEQANELVAWLMRLAKKYQIGIVGVIHLNPGHESKTRGHLGSQLTRKAETTLQIDLDGEVKMLYTAKARHKPLPKSQAMRFQWSDDEHGFVEIEGTPAEAKQAAKIEEWTRTLRDIESETAMLAWKYGELVEAIQKAESLRSPTTAKSRINSWLDAGILRHDSTRGTYLSALDRSIDEMTDFSGDRSISKNSRQTA